MVQRLQRQRFIYSPHAARSSVTKRVAAPAFSFNLPAVNPVNKVVCVRTRMTGPGQPHASDLHRAPPTHCSPSLYLPVWGDGEEPTARTSRSRQSQFELDSRLPAGLQPHPRRLLLTNSAPKTTYHCWDYWTHTHTHSMSMAYSVPTNTDILLLKRHFVPQVSWWTLKCEFILTSRDCSFQITSSQKLKRGQKHTFFWRSMAIFEAVDGSPG